MAIKPNIKPPPELSDLAEQIGQFIEYWGFKKIHGQIWTYIFLAAEPIDATTLVKRLGVSKALVSLAIKDLLKYEVIQKSGRQGRRTVLYISNPDLIKVITSILRMRERKMISQIHSSLKNFRKLKMKEDSTISISLDKTDALEEMIETAENTLDAIIAADLMVQCEGTDCQS